MNSLYNRLMAEKGAPRAANNPNTTQLRSAPMNLRSAMNKYAEGGGVGSPPPPASDINNFMQANIGNPQAIMQAAQQYGVSMDDLASATGYSSDQINNYFGNAGLGSMGTQPALADSDPVNLGVMDTSQTTEESLSPYLPKFTPAAVSEESLSPYLPTFTPPAVSEKSLSPYLPTFTPPNSTISPELLKIMQERGNLFGSQITQQDEMIKLIEFLKGK